MSFIKCSVFLQVVMGVAIAPSAKRSCILPEPVASMSTVKFSRARRPHSHPENDMIASGDMIMP
jgi:hypothetical protein